METMDIVKFGGAAVLGLIAVIYTISCLHVVQEYERLVLFRWGRFQSVVNALLGLSGQGTQAAGALAGNAIQTGANVGGQNTNIGQAGAGAAIGTGNAISGATSSLSNLATLNALTGGQLFNNTTGGAWGNAQPFNYNTGAGTV